MAKAKRSNKSKTSAASSMTTDHEQIRRWAEERGGKPARVLGTGDEEDPGMIRIDFPGFSGEGSLEPISWEEFFEKFEEKKLALVVENAPPDSDKARFNKIVRREAA